MPNGFGVNNWKKKYGRPSNHQFAHNICTDARSMQGKGDLVAPSITVDLTEGMNSGLMLDLPQSSYQYHEHIKD